MVQGSFGNFLAARRTRIHATCVASVETLALQGGCELGLSLGLTHVVVESDSQATISCMQGIIFDGR